MAFVFKLQVFVISFEEDSDVDEDSGEQDDVRVGDEEELLVEEDVDDAVNSDAFAPFKISVALLLLVGFVETIPILFTW